MSEFVPSYVTPQPGEVDSLARILEALGSATKALSEEVLLHLEQNDDAAAAALLLLDLREALDPLKDLVAAVEATAAQRMPGKTLDVPGYVIERKGGTTNHKWDDSAVAYAVLQRLAVDSTGTLDDSALDLLTEARDELLKVASVSYWRINALKEAGITDPYQWRTSEKGRYTVHVARAVEDVATGDAA